ncbi:ESPR domain-containing protein [Dyella sp.]|uniref:ESPR domain-containing protein n=1 Tax=Dyella sp. TaxID=1869338 RepID=UPI00284F67A3|nr:ESPR domain-containing protein [Dyella sp.]MDR3446794.1 ESPR domain-containing protein [Dyella sp.]
MNKIYRIVWNVTTCRWVVASEMATGRKKSGSASVSKIGAGLFAIGMGISVVSLWPSAAMASGFCSTNGGAAKSLDSANGVANNCTPVPGWWDGTNAATDNAAQVYALYARTYRGLSTLVFGATADAIVLRPSSRRVCRMLAIQH